MSIIEQINALRVKNAAEIEAFLLRVDMSAARFGELAMGDRRFVYEVRKGRKVEVETIEQLQTFMKNYRKPPSVGKRVGNARAAA